MSQGAPMPRMRRHKRRLVDDGTDLSIAVRDFIESVAPLEARQADNSNGIGRSGNAPNAAPAMGGSGNARSSTTADDTTTSAAASTSARSRAVPTPTTTTSATPDRTPSTTAAATTTSADLIDQILSSLTAVTSTSTTSSSRVSSTTSTTSSTSTSTSTSSATSTTSSSIKPITATLVVTSTPTHTVAAVASATAATKSVSSAAGPIIGIVAGSLVGIVVLSGLIGFLFKKYNKKEDPYEGNPFDRDAFQRHSTMIPDNFDSDDGHNGMSPEMSEHHQQFNAGPRYESGLSAGVMAGITGAGVMAHNEGGPRPPTMFARHAQQQQQQVPQVGGYYKDGDYSHMANVAPSHEYGAAPPTAAFVANGGYMEDPYSHNQGRSISPAPQMPPLAAFGGDPYSTAGVGRNQQYSGNVNNPYAHLDRAQPGQYVSGPRSSASGSIGSASSRDQRHASVAAAESLAAGLAHQSSLNRSAYTNGEAPAPAYSFMGEHNDVKSSGPNPFDPAPAHHQPTNQLQVRNLVPSAGQRPISSASSFAEDEDAYGGVY